MIHPGDVIREAEYRKKELERERALRRSEVGDLGALSGHKSDLRDTYYRQLAKVGRQMCTQGFDLGCTLESHALAHSPAATN
jgi:hypothetical protein